MRSAVKAAKTAIENNAENKAELVSLAVKKLIKLLKQSNSFK